MDNIFLITVLAVTVEALMEYAKSVARMFAGKDYKEGAMRLAAAVTAVVLCVLAGADFFAGAGVKFISPAVGEILTGVVCSRGANYVSDFVGKTKINSP